MHTCLPVASLFRQNPNRIVRPSSPSSQRRSPKHRLEKPVSKRPLLLTLTAAGACTAVALGVATAGSLGLPAFGVVRAAEVHAVSTPSAEPAPVATRVVSGTGASAGPVTGGTTVTVHGADLAGVSTVTFGGKPGTVVAATDDAVTITTPPATGLKTGTVPVKLFDEKGDPVVAKSAVPATTKPVAKAAAAAVAAAADAAAAAAAPAAKPGTATTATPAVEPSTTPTPAPAVEPSARPTPTPAPAVEPSARPTPTPAPAGKPSAEPAPAPAGKPSAKQAPASAAPAVEAGAHPTAKPITLTFRYLPDPHVTAQIDYVLAHWNDYNSDEFGAIPGNDCVNFTSQSLLARGWKMDGQWSFNRDTFQSTAAWTSSTALADYLSRHPERATPLTDNERSQVKVGDIVQFDWDNSGDRDHTGIVTKVEKTDAGTVIRFAGHTADTDYASVDDAIAGGASVSYWSVS